MRENNTVKKKAILVVSFGTTHKDTREKTISVMKREIENEFLDYKVYEAWTSSMIRNIVLKEENLKIKSVKEAMQQMLQEGITQVVIQPTHVINGVENDSMKEDADAFQKQFDKIIFGTPLLTAEKDFTDICEILKAAFLNIPKDEAVVFMGHGTTHYANSAYAALEYECKDRGFLNFFMGTVEAYPDLEAVLRRLETFQPKRVHVAPFMIVAGDHAKNDLAGDKKDSWKNVLKEYGYETNIILKGLGEYEAIREVFIRHIKESLENNEKKRGN
jgi:cobalamin biosynthesis Co2+ chelatase CbiK